MDSERTEVSTLGEFGLIDHLTKNNEIRNASTIVAIGDDAAVLDHFGKQTVVTTDMLVEGIHFDLMYKPKRCVRHECNADADNAESCFQQPFQRRSID